MNQRPTRLSCSVTGSSETTCPAASSRAVASTVDGRVVGKVVEEVDHQDEVEAFALRDELGRVHAAERVPVVAATPARMLDVGAVQVDADVPARRQRGVLADSAADVEHARLAFEQPPPREEGAAAPVEPEGEIEPDPARLPHERPVEDAHRPIEGQASVRADDRLRLRARRRTSRLDGGAVVRVAEAVDLDARVPGVARLGDRSTSSPMSSSRPFIAP